LLVLLLLPLVAGVVIVRGPGDLPSPIASLSKPQVLPAAVAAAQPAPAPS